MRFGQILRLYLRPLTLQTLVNDVTSYPHRYALAWAALLVAGSSLGGCGRPESNPPQAGAAVTPVSPSIPVPVTGGVKDGSLPDTTAALSAPGTASAGKASPPSTMTQDQESKAMPMPGQANDHSTPKIPKPKGG